MIRSFCIATGAMLVACAVQSSQAQPPAGAPNPQPPDEDTWSGQLIVSFQIIRLNQQVMSLYDEGKFQEAVPVAKRCLALVEKTLGPTDPLVARSLGNLANLYWRLGAYDQAEPLLVRALELREKGSDPTNPEMAHSLTSLAALYQARGAYAKAEPLLVRALDIREKALGPMNQEVAQGLNNLAMVYKAQGAYAKAEPLLVRARTILEKGFGPMYPDVAMILNNLAALYQEQGAYGKAEPLYHRALAIREAAHGSMHVEVAQSLNNLAVLYWNKGAYEQARPLYRRAIDIMEKALGPMHPDLATGLTNLADLYKAQGAYGKAEPLYVRALDIREKVLGPMHPDVATSLNNLALLYKIQGAYGKAEPLYVRALDIADKALGVHPTVAIIVNNLATLYEARGVHDQAVALLSRAAEIRERQLRDELGALPEPRKRALMARLQGDTDQVVSVHADALPYSDRALELALTTVLRRKGRILDSLVDNETALQAHSTPAVRAELAELAQARSELVARLYAPSDPRSSVDRAAIAAVRAHIDDLEAALSATSAAFRTQAEPVTVAKIQAALSPGQALVEFVRYRRHDPRDDRQPWQEDRYAAYLVTPDGPLQWVALGAATPIDAGINAVLAAMNGGIPTSTAEAALQRLDALVFASIRARLTGVSHVILAPDGRLNLIPFEALIDPQGHHVLEDYLVSYVTTGRDLLWLTAPRPPQSPAVIVAAPDYGAPSSPGKSRATPFQPLKGAAAEAADLQPYFSALAWTGGKATKSALAALTGPAMLHIATHAFYARASGTRPTPVPPALLRGILVDGDISPLPQPPLSEDPADGLDRAGLAMAGANRGPGGIVTAREIAGFDWWGTQLVVLSACETGVGAVPSGEGVYGLRRALVLAGTEAQVVSLWSVSDASTRELMRDYYAELARGTGRAEALRQAKLRLMHQPRYAHPFYWAAFIPAGDWRPLDGSTIPHQGAT